MDEPANCFDFLAFRPPPTDNSTLTLHLHASNAEPSVVKASAVGYGL